MANARSCDLLVLGYPRPPGLPSDWSLDRLLIESGGPTLVIPDGWQANSIGRRIVVAWNASREARRAVRDAIPLLSTAQSVIVLMVDPERSEHKFFGAPGVDVARFLKRHGASVDLCQLKSHDGSIADAILSETFKREADVVVIGAY